MQKMQDLMFQCGANGCMDNHASMQQVHHCIKRHHAPLVQGQALVTSELEKFQGCWPGASCIAMTKPKTQWK